jgi:3-methyladenine DNA glycosylase AlkD
MVATQSVAEILDSLKNKGTEKTRITYARHGMAPERLLGVSVADLKTIAKTIKGQQALALALYETGMMEAMYLAGIVADGALMSRKELRAWADGASGLPMIAEHTVPWVTVESPFAEALAAKWIGSKKEQVASAGWCTYSGLVATKADAALDLERIEELLAVVASGIDAATGRARYTMNGFVISVGTYVKPLLAKAKSTARQIGEVSVDMGDTACEVPVAAKYIAKVEAMGKVGQKRKTIRC